MKESIFRGVLIGTAVGVFATLLGILPPGDAIILGGIMGILAGLTMYRIRKKQGK